MHEDIAVLNSTPLPLPSPSALRRVSWGAIFAGVAVALSIQVLLNLLGIGIGASTIDPRQGDTPGQGLAIGAGIWFVVSALIALFACEVASGRMAGVPNGKDRMLHGFATWSVTTMFTIYLLSTAVGSLVGGTATLLKNTGSFAGSGLMHSTPLLPDVTTQVTGMTPAEIQQQAGDVAADPRFETFVQQVATTGSATPQAEQNLADLLAQKQNISQAQAEQEIDGWQNRLQQAKQQASKTAVNVAGDAAEGLPRTALWGSLVLFLGAITATLGGLTGSPTFALRRRTSLEPVRV